MDMNAYKKRSILYIVVALVVLAVSSTDIYIAAMPQMVTDLNSNAGNVSFTITTFMAGLAIGTLLTGLIGDRFGRRRTILIGNAIYAISSLAIALSPSIFLIIGLRFVQALASSVNGIVGRQCLHDIMDEKELLVSMSLINSGMVLSPALAPVLGAILSQHFGWRVNFTFSAVAAIILLITVWFYLPETLPANQRISKIPSFSNIISGYFQIINHSGFNANNMISMFGYGAYYAFITASSFIYVNRLGISPTVFSAIFIATAATYLVGTWGNRKMCAKNIDNVSIIWLGCRVSLAGAFLTFIAWFWQNILPVAIILTVAACFMRGGLGLLMAPTQVRSLGYFKKNTAQALGMIFFTQFAAGSLASAWISTFHYNHLYGMVIVAGILSVAEIPLYYFSRNR